MCGPVRPKLEHFLGWYTNTTTLNTISGNSMAPPHVARLAAFYLQAHPAATPADVTAAIKAAATLNVVLDP